MDFKIDVQAEFVREFHHADPRGDGVFRRCIVIHQMDVDPLRLVGLCLAQGCFPIRRVRVEVEDIIEAVFLAERDGFGHHQAADAFEAGSLDCGEFFLERPFGIGGGIFAQGPETGEAAELLRHIVRL